MITLEELDAALRQQVPEGFKTISEYSREWGISRSSVRERLEKARIKKLMESQSIGRFTYYKLLLPNKLRK